ncbi:high affinity cAMP-specific and IBMX-insensitive 3',5'-cyclic phosphodiesterase 8 isoform X1 [Glossina fuscipes]|uniref:3',5'-cyclic-AMP phosphodiesterase n=2 Tax=Glossina fuscipes TaxID=7396 RepID=A0A9C5Z7G7_9MUSC|nr:high affinity cAMP-specific and IBMX-insensitive 3',5'-cyclic phosphodiesterase 8 isoform X1 [Glossina fuscipes]
MRNCFTKIANIFRKSPLQNQLIHENLYEECLQLDHCEGDTKEGKLKVTRSQLTIVNGPDGSTSTSDKLAHGDNNENDKTTNTMSHRKISNEKVDNKLYAIQTSIQTTPSLLNEKDKQHCFRTKSQHKKIRSKNIRIESNFDHNRALVGKENDNEIDVSENLLLQKSIEPQETNVILEELETHLRTINSAKVTNICAKDFENGMKASSNVTAEDIDDEARIAAEGTDLVTPLPRSNPLRHYGYARSLQPDIIDAIRNLDAHALRINNISLEDKLELLRRYEHKQKFTRFPCHISIKSNLSSASEKQENNQVEQLNMDLQKNNCDDVVLRGKPVSHRKRSLYERRQPRQPKLKLIIKKAEDQDPCLSKITTEAVYLLPTVVAPKLALKGLLVFSKEDKIFHLVQQACNRREVDISIARTLEATTEKLTTGPDIYHLIVIDGRYPNFLDAAEIAKAIRLTEGYNCATIVALVKRSFFESDATMTAFLDAGVNTCIVECYHLPYLNMELKQIISTTVKHYSIISTQEVLYTALNRIKDVLIITDNKFVIQYVNQAAAHLLGVLQKEPTKKHLSEYFVSDLTQWINALKPKDLTGDKPLDFAGTVLIKGKTLESTSFPVRARQLACYGRITTHLIFNVDVPVISQGDSSIASSHTRDFRGSFAAARRSSDLKGIPTESRRASAAKLAAMPLEAPITKIINLLSQLHENCSTDEAHLIDRVLDFLKYESLYSPQMKDIQMEDPIATELIGALITGSNVHSSRRSSNDSTIRTAVTRPTASLISTMKAAPLIMDSLKESLSWEFDIFRFEKITEKRPLLYLGMEIFDKFKVFTSMRMDQTVFKNWFLAVESRYHAQNAYHNSTHAADVLQAIGVFLSHFSKKEMSMDCLEESSALIAAVVHDIDHPGRSSAYLCNSNNPLAILYNDVTVLENHHAAYFFKLTLCDDSVNIFKNLEPDIYKSMRNIIIDMILATEMTRHFEHLAKFVSVFGGEMNCNKEIAAIEEDSALLMRRMLIKVADVSNPSRPYLFCVEWAQRIAEEYFQQTEEEKTQNMPIVMPMFDRCTCSIPKSQIGFIEYIVMDMLLAWDNFIDMPELITYTRNNLEMWKHLEEEGVRTIADVKRSCCYGLPTYSNGKSNSNAI